METISVDTLIFDFDGVLVDTGPDVASAANQTLKLLGLAPLPEDLIISFIGGGAEVLMRRCLGVRFEALLAEAMPIFLRLYTENCCVKTRLYPGVAEVLEHYARIGKSLAIATQKVEAITHTILKTLQVKEYFRKIVGPESVTHRKPHPEAVLKILGETGTASSRAIIIGDTASDIQSGKAAGIFTCGVRYGYGSEEELQSAQPDLYLEKLIQLMDWVY
jgi:2-phosphoglycolate phosphatase